MAIGVLFMFAAIGIGLLFMMVISGKLMKSRVGKSGFTAPVAATACKLTALLNPVGGAAKPVAATPVSGIVTTNGPAPPVADTATSGTF